MAKIQVLIEFWEFLRFNKKYWMLPIVIVLVLVGLLIVMAQGSAVHLHPFLDDLSSRYLGVLSRFSRMPSR